MALFPEAKIKVLLPRVGVIPGTRLEGTLEIWAAEPIPRAHRIDLAYRTRALLDNADDVAPVHRDLFVARMKIKLDPDHSLTAGTHAYPFAIAIPAWLPPAYAGAGCAVRHSIDVRIGVEWALDQTLSVTPTVVLPPTEAVAYPISTRSPPGFHESLVVDLFLETDTIVEGEALRGEVALRSGRDASFDALKIVLTSVATVKIIGRERRRGTGAGTRVRAERLRQGGTVPFAIAHMRTNPPSFGNNVLDHDYVLIVEAERSDKTISSRSFDVPVHVMPAGSKIHRGESSATPLGSERLELLAAAMARATGLRQGRLPVLVEGKAGCVAITIADSPRDGAIGVDVALDVPDLALGIALRPAGKSDKVRSGFLPPMLAERYALTVTPERPIAMEAIAAYFAALFANFDVAADVRMTDRQLGFRVALTADGSEDVIACARWAKERAEILGAAIGRLPFSPPFEASAPAWAAMAAEQSATLYPHVPAIHGIKIGTRIASGEQREMGVVLRARVDGTVTADLDLTSAPLPPAPNRDGLRAVMAVFPRFEVQAPERASLEGAVFPPVPTLLLGTLEAFLGWLLDVRGERRSDGPYR